MKFKRDDRKAGITAAGNMNNRDKTDAEPIEEPAVLRRRIAELESAASGHSEIKKPLHDSEELYRNLFENINDIILFVNFKGDILDANKKAEEISGYSRDCLPMSILSLTGARQALKFARRLMQLKIKKKLPPTEYTMTNKNGQKVVVEITSTLLEIKGEAKGFWVVGRDIGERKKSEEKIRRSLKEKEVLLKEIHHRVKNNMQIISSLLSLQEMNLKDPAMQKIFRESQTRIRSMALIHDKLYRSQDVTRIDIGDYINDLAIELFRAYDIDPSFVLLENNIKKTYFDLDTAIPCCLVINELVSNSLKHAFPDGQTGKITIDLDLDKKKNEYLLSIKDNGVGLPGHIDPAQAETLGMQLVGMFVKKLHGAVEFSGREGKGTEIKIKFKEHGFP